MDSNKALKLLRLLDSKCGYTQSYIAQRASTHASQVNRWVREKTRVAKSYCQLLPIIFKEELTELEREGLI